MAARAHVIGLTGPPGVGKSTLTNVLVARARARGETVGVLAVDPSSRRTGGALLGDRARIATDPEDRGIFVRSMAARDRLGGLSDQTVAAMVLMRAIYDLVLVELVGIGQSEADISFVADTVVLCVQPGSGDSLQFMKAGVTELPDVVAVTKADMIDAARRTRADVEGALTLYSEQRRARGGSRCGIARRGARRSRRGARRSSRMVNGRRTPDAQAPRAAGIVDRAGDPRALRIRGMERVCVPDYRVTADHSRANAKSQTNC